MGSQTILDLIASTMVFSSLLLMTLRINASGMENLQMYRDDLLVQQNLVEVTKLIEYDFRKIGYCKDYTKIPNPYLAIRYADSMKIRFWTDFPSIAEPQGDGILDSLTYFVGPTSEASATDNPNDRLIYRVENNNTPVGVNMGVTEFKLQYFDALKNQLATPVADPRQIQYLQITVQIEALFKYKTSENIAAYDTVYQNAFWRQVRLVAKNLNNR